ncbi:hypothetical protein [Mariniflexile sp.]|uniref:hypothetical protein n=1 Tax=Mariniflexile sp. TaxID=1979402 RepID=UPI003562767F
MKNSKFLLALLISVSMLSCSSDDSDSNNSNFKFNPPSWIQGVWFEENSQSGLKFTSDDIIRLTLDANNSIIKEDSRKQYWSLFEGPYTIESSSSNTYKSEVHLASEISGTGGKDFYEFQKTSENSMTMGTTVTWIKQ